MKSSMRKIGNQSFIINLLIPWYDIKTHSKMSLPFLTLYRHNDNGFFFTYSKSKTLIKLQKLPWVFRPRYLYNTFCPPNRNYPVVNNIDAISYSTVLIQAVKKPIKKVDLAKVVKILNKAVIRARLCIKSICPKDFSKIIHAWTNV